MTLLPLGILSSSGAVAGGDFELIATTVLTGTNTSGITFSSIPQTYKHLQLRFVYMGDNGTPIVLKFNEVGGTSYGDHLLSGNGSYVSSGVWGGTGIPFLYVAGVNGATGVSNIPTFGITDILDYTNTNKNKTTKTLSGNIFGGANEINLWSGLFSSNNAITSLSINSNLGLSMYANSRFSLYGVKG